jgi:hypothetical protein
MKRSFRRRGLLLGAVAALVVAVAGGTALAGHINSGVKSYTGCLTTNGGTLTLIKEGTAPLKPCPSGSLVAHFSGGDITKISVSGGLTLPNGGDNGEVTIALDPKYSLPQSCADAEVAKWDDTTSAWVCATDENRIYEPGTGLELVNTTIFRIQPDYRVKNTPDCASGQFATGFDSNGEIQCASTSTGIEAWQRSRGNTNLPKGEGVDLIMLPLPAGTYLITAVANVRDDSGTINGDEEVSVRCFLRNAANATLPVRDSFVDIGEAVDDDNGPAAPAVVHGAISLASPDTVKFTCTSSKGDDDAEEAEVSTMTAIKVATLHTP